MENKVFSLGLISAIGWLGTVVYGVMTNNLDLASEALPLGVAGVFGISVTYGGTTTTSIYKRYINDYRKGRLDESRISAYEDLYGDKCLTYCYNVGLRRAQREIEEGKVELPLDRS